MEPEVRGRNDVVVVSSAMVGKPFDLSVPPVGDGDFVLSSLLALEVVRDVVCDVAYDEDANEDGLLPRKSPSDC
jgi:hypothetical protein